VLGDVAHPGAYRLTADMSFMDAFSQAGGAVEDGDTSRTALIRAGVGQREIPMKQILAGHKELNFALEEGDIVFVPKRGVAKFGYYLQKASPITGFAILYNAVK
jgi:polysaccharide export outer membrane protein